MMLLIVLMRGNIESLHTSLATKSFSVSVFWEGAAGVAGQ